MSTSLQRRFGTILTGLLLAILLAACASDKDNSPDQARANAKTPPASASGRRSPQDRLQQRAQAHAHYAAGVIHDLNNQPEAARDEFYQAARKDPASEELVLEVSRRLLQAKQSDRALEILTRASEIPGASGAIFAWLGVACSHAGKTNQAVAANRTAIARDPTSLLGYQNLFVAHIQARQDDAAFAILEEAYAQKNVTPEYLSSLADLYISLAIQVPARRKAAHERALAALKTAAALNPAQTALQLKIAETFIALGESEEAAKIWHHVLKTAPDVPLLREQVHARLADVYLRSADKQRAIEQLQALIRKDPTNPQAYYFLGSLALDAQDLPTAVEHLNKTLILAPTLEQAYYDLASAQIGLRKPAEARTTLAKARERFGQTFVLELLTALACAQDKSYTDAVQHFTAAEIVARATEPKRLTPAFYFQFGAALERKGDFSQAETSFRKCLELDPDNHEAQNYLGYMWAERGTNLSQARELIEKACTAQPTNAAYLDSLGWVLFKQGHVPEALEKIQRSIELLEQPDPTVFDHLGDIHHFLKQPQKAREAWQKSLDIEPNETISKKLQGHTSAAENQPEPPALNP